MGHNLEPSGLGFRWLLVPISVGLILVLSYWNTVAAQPIKDRRLRPAAPIPVNQAPHLSEKEQYKRWRSEQDNRNRVKLRTEPLRAANEVSAETLLINEGFEGVTFPPV